MMKRLLVFASGNGSNFEAIVKYFKGRVHIELLCDKADCYAMVRAKKIGVRAHYVPFCDTYNFLKNMPKFDLYVLAGYMRILPPEVLEIGTFINIHPSLLPKYKGKDAILRAYNNKELFMGVSVHYVTDEVDCGTIILQKNFEVCNMNFDETVSKMHETEHNIYPQTIDKLLGLNVLVVGSGAREHAICNSLLKSKFLKKLYLAGANDGFSNLGTCVEYDDFSDLALSAKFLDIDLAVIGPEYPLSCGLHDKLMRHKIKCIGAKRCIARLEFSKSYAKSFMNKHKLPCAKTRVVYNANNIETAIYNFSLPPVIKVDGLCAGKGVFLPDSYEEAITIAKKMFDKHKIIVLEERLFGEELSLICLYDGKTLLPLPYSRDYKKLQDDNIGPNTGGMGAYCPVAVDDEVEADIQNYLKKLEAGLKKSNMNFTGVIYSGLMLAKEGVRVLEFNMRFGDPECQAILMNLENDLLELFVDTVNQNLENVTIKTKDEPSICVVVAANGYPDNPKIGAEIENVEEIEKKFNVKIFYANVKRNADKLFANGGRVLSVCSNSRKDIYEAIENLKFDDKIYRKDIMKCKN